MSEFGKVAVLMGGPSSEREISFLSGNAVLAALKSRGVDAHAFDPAERSLYSGVGPLGMSLDGMLRYFNKREERKSAAESQRTPSP